MVEAWLAGGPLLAQSGTFASNAALVTFVVYTMGVFVLAWVSNRLRQSKSFLSEYFLGSRSLGVWAFALTFAATSASGGSFTGFPSKIYTHGWVLALWIGSYMVVPICTMGILGKRLNQVARKTGAITVPDVIRDRFHSAAFGLVAILLIVFFMSFNLVAQFKAGSLILRTLLSDVPLFKVGVVHVSGAMEGIAFLDGVDPGYMLCLVTFAFAVIIYTTYGGFHAVVWTDVMQGVVMVVGVLIMLPLALSQVGGLQSATEQLASMTPPTLGKARLEIAAPVANDRLIEKGTWMVVPKDGPAGPRILRTAQETVISAGETAVENVDVLEITTPEEVERIRRSLAALEETEGTRSNQSSIPISATVTSMEPYAYGGDERGVYVSGPGPDPKNDLGFLPLSLAVSFFFMWAISGTGQPSSMVRLMAFNNTQTLRRAIFTVAIYYSCIYFPLIIIFCCARVLLPGMEQESDRIMPATAVLLSTGAGVPWLAGLLVAAPFAAVMSTVDSFLLMISSALVRDVYQRNINPKVSERTVKRMSYAFTFVVGMGAMLGAVNPPEYLQDIIVYTGSGLAACFLAPVALALYWPRINTPGAMCGMLGGFLTHLSLYLAGFLVHKRFAPYSLFSMDPIIWGLAASFIWTIVVTKLTAPPPADLVRRYFYKPQ